MLHTYKSTWGKAWIGLNDIATEDVFVWEDGTKLTYHNFAPGEGIQNTSLTAVVPHPNEDCVIIDVHDNGWWRDYPCDTSSFLIGTQRESHAYICQYKAGGS
ncbi:unnamed protein product [Lymnaea stagnalis]|uniref:C-type lectin domain-containing protein n=1 Tax=Lymnaea stagnalis TaxID=6523 RepID=A0AAV2H0H1_LYMST